MAQPVFYRGNLVAQQAFFFSTSQKVVAGQGFSVADSMFLFVLYGKCRTDFVQVFEFVAHLVFLV